MKIDVTVSKKMTINTGNYSSIQPSVSITAKDIDVKDYDEVKEDLTSVMESLFIQNLEVHSDDMQMIKDHGLPRYLSSINREQMNKEIENCLRRLSNV